MSTFRLYWKDRDLGEVYGLSGDHPWVWATVLPSPGLDDAFRELFAYLVDENQSVDPLFAEELLEDDDWWLVDGRGKRWGISLPAIHMDENVIAWRWRGEIPKWMRS